MVKFWTTCWVTSLTSYSMIIGNNRSSILCLRDWFQQKFSDTLNAFCIKHGTKNAEFKGSGFQKKFNLHFTLLCYFFLMSDWCSLEEKLEFLAARIFCKRYFEMLRICCMTNDRFWCRDWAMKNPKSCKLRAGRIDIIINGWWW